MLRCLPHANAPKLILNSTTLLLTHMPSQKLNQHRLETYLSASSHPTYDVLAHMESSQSTVLPSTANAKHASGTSTPRDLNTRLRLLELYTLNILPQNGEWDYARDFINMSEVLDEERRDAFHYALQMLKEEKDHDAIREKELRRRQEEEMQQRQDEDERRRKAEVVQEETRRRSRESHDEGVTSASSKPNPSSRAGGTPAPVPTKSNLDAGGQNKRNASAKGRGPAKRPPASPPPGIFHRAASMLQLMQNRILNMRQTMTRNPMAMLRFLLFLLAFTLALARRDIRERIKQTVNDGWTRVRRTIGMGVKVSYI